MKIHCLLKTRRFICVYLSSGVVLSARKPFVIYLVRKEGLEPSWISPPDPKSGASANSATLAKGASGKKMPPIPMPSVIELGLLDHRFSPIAIDPRSMIALGRKLWRKGAHGQV